MKLQLHRLQAEILIQPKACEIMVPCVSGHLYVLFSDQRWSCMSLCWLKIEVKVTERLHLKHFVLINSHYLSRFAGRRFAQCFASVSL
jgi:hypothetical protein